MYLVKSLSRDKGSGRYTMYLSLSPYRFLGRKGQIHCVSTGPLVPGEGLYQIHAQSLNTHRGKHRSGGAQDPVWMKLSGLNNAKAKRRLSKDLNASPGPEGSL